MISDAIGAPEKVRDAVYRACLLLDDEKWEDWLNLCDESFEYEITAWSPEIRKDMIYFSGSRDAIKSMTDMLDKHNTDHSPLRRHANVYTIDKNDDGTFTAVSSVAVYQNRLDGFNSHIDAGESHLFVIGRYVDRLKIENGEARFLSRKVELDTRRLDKGSHWPI
jgi:methanesulfonate monooxygenase small subunit